MKARRGTPAFKIPPLGEYADLKAAAAVSAQGVRAIRPNARRGLRGLGAYLREGMPYLMGAYREWLTSGSVPKRMGFSVLVLVLVFRASKWAGYWVMAGAVLLIILAAVTLAYRAGFRYEGEADSKAPEDDALTALVREEIGADNGVHLADLRPAMRAQLAGLEEASDEELLEVLVEAGFDPSRTFRARGFAGRSGVHRTDPALAPPPPEPLETESAPLSAPESGPDLRKRQVTLRPESGAESGRRVVRKRWTADERARGWRVEDDADNPARTHIVRLPK